MIIPFLISQKFGIKRGMGNIWSNLVLKQIKNDRTDGRSRDWTIERDLTDSIRTLESMSMKTLSSSESDRMLTYAGNGTRFFSFDRIFMGMPIYGYMLQTENEY